MNGPASSSRRMTPSSKLASRMPTSDATGAGSDSPASQDWMIF